MHDLREPQLAPLKRILCYLQGAPEPGLLHRSSTTELIVYIDDVRACCPDSCQSTLGCTVFLGDNLVSWSSKSQKVVSRLSAYC
jgi:hypothetical protein